MPFLKLPDQYLFWFILGCLTTWRISSALVDEAIFEGFREKIIGIKSDPEIDIPDNFFGHLFSCVWCMSMWIGLLMMPAFLFFPWLFLPFAFSAGAILIHRAT